MEFRYCYVLLLQVIIVSYHGTLGQDEEFSIVPVNTTAKVAFPVRLDCRPVNSGSIIRWFVGGGLMIGTNHSSNLCLGCTTLTNGSLYIPSVLSSHANRYTCYIPPGLHMVDVYLTVAESPSIVPTSSNMQFNQDGTLQINVDITGVPQPNVTWRYNGANLTNPRATTSNTGLTITNVERNDAGIYSVTAQNCVDLETEEYNVKINFRPLVTLTRIPDSAIVGVGAIVNLTCSVVSFPQSNVIFQQKNSDGVVERNYTQNVMHTESTYQFSSTSRLQFNDDDITGPSKFCCIAANNFGEASHCLSFQKIGTPEPPVLQASSVSPSSIAMSWNMLSSVTYQLRYRMQGTDTWTAVSNDIPSSETSRTLNELTANTVYEIEIRATTTTTEGNLQSPPSTTLATTRPAKVEGFTLDSVAVRGTFSLTWQAPVGRPIIQYILHYTMMGNMSNITIPSTSTMWSFTSPTSNTIYQFTIQAVNDGGAGPMSDTMVGYFCDIPSITAARALVEGTSFLNITWTIDNPLGVQLNGTVFIMEETIGNSEEVYTSALVPAGSEHECIGGLEPGTLYTIKIVAVYACENSSYTVNIRTALGTADDVSAPPECLVYSPISTAPTPGSDSANLEGWQIALIIVVPLVAVVIMLSIGIYCACRRKSHNTELEMGTIANMNNKDYTQAQAHVHHNHTRNNSSSSVTGTSYRSESIPPLTPTRSNLPYSSNNRSPTWNQPVDTTRLQEHTTVTSV